jgi:anaerobic magnesium-protoporphyrin IX monomethyl ester cyclase
MTHPDWVPRDECTESLPFGRGTRARERSPFVLQPLGKPRVVLFNYRDGDTPDQHAPDAVLVRPNETSPEAYYAGRFWENLGVLTLTRHLEQNGVRFGVVEATLFQCGAETTAELATRYAPRIIGISVYCTYMVQHAIDLAVLIKARQPDALVVLGGHGVSFVPREILEDNPVIDAVVRGEGETALLALARAPGRDAWDTVPSLYYRVGGEVRANPPGPILRHYDEAPLPHRFARDIMQTDPVLAQAPLMMLSSKGCFDRCKFCTVTAFYAGGWKGRSPAHVVDELEWMLDRYGPGNLHFWDDTFTGPGRMGKRRAIGIAEEIKRRGLKLGFHITTRPSDLTEEVVAALASAGLRSVFIGMETSQQSVIDEFDKHATVEQSNDAIERLARHGVQRIIVGFILFHPGMSWKSFYGDLDLLDGLPTMESSRILSRLIYYPGSQLWLDHRSELGPDAYKRPYTPALPSPEFETLYRVCVNYYRQTMEIMPLIGCLEDLHLQDDDAIAFIAERRIRLWRFLSARARVTADHLRLGGNHGPSFERACREIFIESLSILREIELRFSDAYFERLLQSFELRGYERHLKEPVEAPVLGAA